MTEMDIERFVEAQDSEYFGYAQALQEMQDGAKHGHWIWYFLKLIWFDYAPDPAMSLIDYICSITKPMNFFDVCEKLTEKQINYWC